MSIRHAMAIVLLLLQFGSVVNAGDKLAAGKNAKEEATGENVPEPVLIGCDGLPVIYKESALVVRNKDGVAAIAFDKVTEKGVTYHYRLLLNGQSKEQVGEGKVFTKCKEVGFLRFPLVTFVRSVDEGNPSIEAGPISLSWHFHTRDRCWITYQSTETRVEVTDAKNFSRIDLKRSLK